MILGDETREEVCVFECDFEDDEAELYAQIGLEKIKEDKSALINYAVKYLLKKYIEGKVKE